VAFDSFCVIYIILFFIVFIHELHFQAESLGVTTQCCSEEYHCPYPCKETAMSKTFNKSQKNEF
jgi:hypothetical protein